MNTKRNLQFLLDKAIEIAENEFKNDVDKAGNPYIIHLNCVMHRTNILMLELGLDEMYSSEDQIKLKIIGVLHDLLEDKDNWTEDMLRAEGFPDDVIAGIVSVTRRKGESYSAFCSRAMENKFGRIVKFADLEDNLNITRLKKVEVTDIDRLNKYLKQWRKFATYLSSLTQGH